MKLQDYIEQNKKVSVKPTAHSKTLPPSVN